MIDLSEDPVEDVFLKIGDKIEPIHAVKEEIEEESIPSIKDVSGASRNLLESPIVTAEKESTHLKESPSTSDTVLTPRSIRKKSIRDRIEQLHKECVDWEDRLEKNKGKFQQIVQEKVQQKHSDDALEAASPKVQSLI